MREFSNSVLLNHTVFAFILFFASKTLNRRDLLNWSKPAQTHVPHRRPYFKYLHLTRIAWISDKLEELLYRKIKTIQKLQKPQIFVTLQPYPPLVAA